MGIDFLTGKPVKSIFFFALPLMASALMQFGYDIVNNIIVGRFVSTEALAALGSTGPINGFIIGTTFGLTTGFSISVAQHFGAKRYKEMNHFAGNSIALAVLVGVLMLTAAQIVSTPILHLIRTPEDIIDLSASYIRILYFAIPFQALYNVFAGIARAVGDSRRPLWFLLIGIICNCLLTLLFVARFGWGVQGAALATLLSHGLSCTCAGIYVFRFNPVLKIQKSDLCLKWQTVVIQLKLGVPMSLQFTITSLGSMVLQSAVNSFGSTAVAAITAANKAENIINIPMSAFGVSTATFVGQNYGAQQHRRIVQTVRRVFVLNLGISVVCSIILSTFGRWIVSLFIKDSTAELMQMANQYLLAAALCFSLLSVLFVLRNTLQGLGFTYSNMVAGAAELLGRLAVAFIFTPLFGFKAVCYAGPVAWLFADVVLLVIYLRKEKYLLRARDFIQPDCKGY